MPLFTRTAAAAALVVLCFVLTTGAAAYAIRRPELRLLETETASRLHADYSRDPDVIKLKKLDAAVIEDADRDDEALETTRTPERVSVALVATPTPEPTNTPRSTPTSAPTQTPAATVTPVLATATAPAGDARPPLLRLCRW